MTLGVAIFASVVLILLVYNKPFRKVSAWVAGAVVVVLVLYSFGVYVSDWHTNRVAKREYQKAVAACIARFPHAANANDQSCQEDPSPANDTWRVVESEPIPPKGFVKVSPPPSNPIIKIYGGEILEAVPARPSTNPKEIDLSAGLVPMVYLRHGQTFAFICGDPNEHKPVILSDSKGLISCP